MLMNLEGYSVKVRAMAEGEPEGTVRQVGTDQATTHNVFLKSKKSCVDNLQLDDDYYAKHGKRLFSPRHRAALVSRAGKAYKGDKPARTRKTKSAPVPVVDPMERRDQESLEDYVARVRAYVEQRRAEVKAG